MPLERLEARFPKQSAAELFLWQMGERLAAPLHHLPLRNQWRMPGAAAVSGATTAATEAAGAASAAGPVGWGLLAAGALAGLASYYL